LLKLPLQIQQVCAVPGGETSVLVCFRVAGAGVDVAKVGEAAHPAVVEGRECCEQTVALGGGERIGILTDSHHQRRYADRLIVRRADDLYSCVTVGDAWSLELASQKERDRSSCKRQGQLEIVVLDVRNSRKEDDLPALSGVRIA